MHGVQDPFFQGLRDFTTIEYFVDDRSEEVRKSATSSPNWNDLALTRAYPELTRASNGTLYAYSNVVTSMFTVKMTLLIFP